MKGTLWCTLTTAARDLFWSLVVVLVCACLSALFAALSGSSGTSVEQNAGHVWWKAQYEDNEAWAPKQWRRSSDNHDSVPLFQGPQNRICSSANSVRCGWESAHLPQSGAAKRQLLVQSLEGAISSSS